MRGQASFGWLLVAVVAVIFAAAPAWAADPGAQATSSVHGSTASPLDDVIPQDPPDLGGTRDGGDPDECGIFASCRVHAASLHRRCPDSAGEQFLADLLRLAVRLGAWQQVR